MTKIGIVGFGNIAVHHAAAFRALGRVELSASTRSEAGRERAKKAGVEEIHADPHALMERVDAAVVCVPVMAIAPVTLELLRHEKPLLVEKPVGLHPDVTRQVERAAAAAKTPVMVAMNRRFYENVQRVKELVRAEGPLLGVGVNAPDRMWKIVPAGIHPEPVLDAWLYANIIHTIDLMRFFGGEVVSCHSVRLDALRPHSPSYAATVLLSSGALGQYTGHFASPGRWVIDLYLPDIRVTFQGHESATVTRIDGNEETLTDDGKGQKPGFLAQARCFRDALSDRSLFEGRDLADAARTMELVRMIREAPSWAAPAR
jgi:predicted dehydrogenase